MAVLLGLLSLGAWITEDVLPKFPKAEELICKLFRINLDEYRNGIIYEEDYEDEEEKLIEV